jgi:hypothetical protein
MRIALAIMALVMTAPGVWAATYTYTGTAYTSVSNYSSCSSGPCANFTTAMVPSGSFTTASPLAVSSTIANVTPTSFSFSDGINTYASTDPNVRLYRLSVTTDSAGNFTGFSVLFELWETGTSPHTTSDQFSYVFLANNATQAYHNRACGSVVASPFSGVADACTSDLGGASSSTATGPSGSFPVGVPTLSTWGALLLAALIAAGGSRLVRRPA